MAKVDAVMSEIHELVLTSNLGSRWFWWCWEIVSYSSISKRRIYERIRSNNRYSVLSLEENYRKNVVVDNTPCTAYIIDTAGQVMNINLA